MCNLHGTYNLLYIEGQLETKRSQLRAFSHSLIQNVITPEHLTILSCLLRYTYRTVPM